jgi:hypothetical protein
VVFRVGVHWNLSSFVRACFVLSRVPSLLVGLFLMTLLLMFYMFSLSSASENIRQTIRRPLDIVVVFVVVLRGDKSR